MPRSGPPSFVPLHLVWQALVLEPSRVGFRGLRTLKAGRFSCLIRTVHLHDHVPGLPVVRESIEGLKPEEPEADSGPQHRQRQNSVQNGMLPWALTDSHRLWENASRCKVRAKPLETRAPRWPPGSSSSSTKLVRQIISGKLSPNSRPQGRACMKIRPSRTMKTYFWMPPS